MCSKSFLPPTDFRNFREKTCVSEVSLLDYLEETDAFYTTTSDYAPGFFICTSGNVLGDTATLLEEDGTRVLALRYVGDHWYIQSLQDSQSKQETA